MRWREYRPRTITERHVSHNPSSFTVWSEAGFALEELIPSTAQSILVTGNGGTSLLRFLTAHVTEGIIAFASVRNHQPLQGRLGRVWTLRAHPRFTPFRQMSFEYVLLVKPSVAQLEDTLSALMNVCRRCLLVFVVGNDDRVVNIAGSLSRDVLVISADGWSVIRIPKKDGTRSSLTLK